VRQSTSLSEKYLKYRDTVLLKYIDLVYLPMQEYKDHWLKMYKKRQKWEKDKKIEKVKMHNELIKNEQSKKKKKGRA